MALIVFLLGISSIMWNTLESVDQSPKIYSIEVLNEFPHDPFAYTQGLLYAGNDTLFESTGLYGKSSVRRVDLHSGKFCNRTDVFKVLAARQGILLVLDSTSEIGISVLFQVTLLTNTGFIYDRDDLTKVEKFTHQMHDGWGLATDGKVLFGSDGTSTLYQFDPRTSNVTEKHIVKYRNHEVRLLNELEFVNGEVWANVYMTDCIVRISPKDGTVVGLILLENLRKGLIAAGYTNIDVLNGIAWDSKSNRLFVTGKLWPTLYEIKLHLTNKHVDIVVIKQLCIP